jgi:hypothetical protein
MNKYVAVGDKRSGYIFLPPLEYWGESAPNSREKWAATVLGGNLAGVETELGEARIYRDGALLRTSPALVHAGTLY